MKLISCPACGREISTEAEFCPGCGHPHRQLNPEEQEKCYKCSKEATTRCIECGEYSCAKHLEPYSTHKTRGLVCKKCIEKFEEDHELDMFLLIAGFVIVLLIVGAIGKSFS